MNEIKFYLDERVDDFLVLANQGIEHSGIAYYKPQTRPLKEIIHGLILIHAALTPDEMVNHIEFL